MQHYRYTGGSTISQDPLVAEMKRVITLNTSPAKRRQPLTDTQLEQLSGLHATGEVFTHTRDMAAFTMARKAMVRPSELPALRDQDVRFDTLDNIDGNGHDKPILFIFVEKRKNDQSRRGHSIVLGPGLNSKTCPLTWVTAYNDMRDPGAHFFFHKPGGKGYAISSDFLNRRLRFWLKKTEISTDVPLTAMCLRVGGATGAAAANVSIYLIKRHGGWRSNAVFRYISDNIGTRLTVSQAF